MIASQFAFCALWRRVGWSSVAVLVDSAALGKTATKDIANIQRLVRGAMGFDAARGDLVEVQMRAFAPEEAAPKAWYEAPVVQDYGQWVALGGGVLLLLAIGFLMWRGRRKAKAAAAASSTLGNMLGAIGLGGLAESVGLGPLPIPVALGPDGQPLDGGELKRVAPQALDYQEKLGQARDLVSGDRDRAMAVARQMLLADNRADAVEAAAPAAAEANDESEAEAA
jgi:flagellar M-ring protein FliF